MKLPEIQHIDRTFWGLFLALIVVAIIALFSASSTLVYMSSNHSVLGPIGHQLFFMAIGVGLAYLVQLVPSKYIQSGGYLLLGVSILLLYLMLLLKGTSLVVTINGAARWMRIGGIVFQPSELAKLSLIIVVSNMLAQIETEEDKVRYFWYTLGLTVATALPILPSNLSTTLLIGGIVFLLWVLAQIPARYLLSVIGVVVLLAGIGYSIVEFGYVRRGVEMDGPMARAVTWVKRIDRKFSHDEQDAKTSKYTIQNDNIQEVYANVAIARGGSTLVGVLPGNSKERDYLPLAFADYIFAIIVEETGIIGALALIFLYLAILFRACVVSSKFDDRTSMLMVMGLALMLTCQALISMLVVVGIGPVTGQPLPLISRGGTSVIITSIYFGIMMCVSREQNKLQQRLTRTREESINDIPDDITIEE